MFSRFSKKWMVAGAAAVAALALAAGAFAYFTSSGAGTGNGAVGTASNYTVTQTGTTGVMLPGSGVSTLSFSIVNAGAAEQTVSSATASVNSYSGSITADAGDITQSGAPIAGCLASWFQINSATVAGADLAAGGSTTGQVVVSMPADSVDKQNACEGTLPDVNYSVN